jgi:hypothetical protein
MLQRWLILALLGVVAVSGCADLREYKINQRNKYLAKRAWDCNAPLYHEVEYPEDFARGFEKGYYDVACGGNGCTPALPPRRYWTVTYASPVGHRRTHAWFEGYKYGAAVAEQDGIGVYITVPTGHPAPPPPIDLKAIMAETSDKSAAPAPAGETPAPTPPKPAPPAPPKEQPPAVTPEPEPQPQPEPEPKAPTDAEPAKPESKDEPKAEPTKKAMPPIERPSFPERKSAAPKNSTAPKAAPKTPAKEMPVTLPDDPGSARLYRSR